MQVVAVLMLGLVILAAVIGITVVAVMTDRELWRAEVLTFGGSVLLAAIGGVSWWRERRHRWRVRVDHNGDHDGEGEPR